MVDLQALAGDASDNVNGVQCVFAMVVFVGKLCVMVILQCAACHVVTVIGVPGIGIKTAAKLIAQFGSMHELYRCFLCDVCARDVLHCVSV
jgi:5'-3' exonuclease